MRSPYRNAKTRFPAEEASFTRTIVGSLIILFLLAVPMFLI